MVGDVFTCFRKHKNIQAVQASCLKEGRDLDDAVLAAINRNIEND